MKFVSSFFLLILLVSPNILISSLVEGTLVKTPQGLVPVERLQVGDLVYSYESEKTLKEVKILRITKEHTDHRLLITTEEGTVVACSEQFFYDIESCKWIKANNINGDHSLIDCRGKAYQCGRTVVVHKPTTIYQITVEFPHTLFISEMEVVTHN